jgi:hypothetical protein
MTKLPITTGELLEVLDELIPEPSPRPGVSLDGVMYELGRRSVVLQLKSMREGSVADTLRTKRGTGRVLSKNA